MKKLILLSLLAFSCTTTSHNDYPAVPFTAQLTGDCVVEKIDGKALPFVNRLSFTNKTVSVYQLTDELVRAHLMMAKGTVIDRWEDGEKLPEEEIIRLKKATKVNLSCDLDRSLKLIVK